MRIEWLIGERQFRLEAQLKAVHVRTESSGDREIVGLGGFVLTIPAQAKLFITEGENHG